MLFGELTLRRQQFLAPVAIDVIESRSSVRDDPIVIAGGATVFRLGHLAAACPLILAEPLCVGSDCIERSTRAGIDADGHPSGLLQAKAQGV